MRGEAVGRHEDEGVRDFLLGQQSGDEFREGRGTYLAGEDNGRGGFLFPSFRKKGKGFGRSANDDHHVFTHSKDGNDFCFGGGYLCGGLCFGGVFGFGNLGGRGFFLCVSGGDIATDGGPGSGRVACCLGGLVLCGFGFVHFRSFIKIRKPVREPYRLRAAVHRCSEGFGTRRGPPAGG